MRPRILLAGTVAALMAMALPGSMLAASPAGACTGGTMHGGTYSSFVVNGNCTIAFGATVHVTGNLTVSAGARLDDHGAELWMHGQVHVDGNIYVHKGAALGLGWNSPQGEGSLGPDTVGGSIIATQPLALQVGQVTIGGNLISNGGGVASTSLADFRNFPVEDNVIHGNLVIQGWRGGWFGVIRNTISGNAIIANVVSVSNGDTGPGTDTDSTEIMGTHVDLGGGAAIDVPQTIGGNLICHDNVPVAQVVPVDAGAPNIVHGLALGECAGLTQ